MVLLLLCKYLFIYLIYFFIPVNKKMSRANQKLELTLSIAPYFNRDEKQ